MRLISKLNEIIFMECQAARRELGSDGAKVLVEAGREVSETLLAKAGR